MKGKMMKNLDKKEWAEFSLNEIFTVDAGKRLENRNKIPGKHPFIGATDNGNGVTGFVGNENSSKDKNVLGVNYNGAPCIAFYHPYECVFTDDVKRLHLINHADTSDILLYFISIFAQQRTKYTYGYKFKEQRMYRQKLMLPVTDSGEPDYEYMSEYIQENRKAMLAKYRAYVKNRIAELGEYVEIPALSEKEWKAIPIVKIFERFDPGKGHGLNHLAQVPLGINYIGATNRNNGVLCSVARTKETSGLIQEGNCIGFIKNGDGAAGFAIYKRERFISTSDVIYGYASWLNLSTGLFFVAAQDMIEKKYSHGYKRNQQHLRGDKVMLPVTDSGEPDYGYMEQYAKNMMIRKYRQYLSFLDAKDKTETVQGR